MEPWEILDTAHPHKSMALLQARGRGRAAWCTRQVGSSCACPPAYPVHHAALPPQWTAPHALQFPLLPVQYMYPLTWHRTIQPPLDSWLQHLEGEADWHTRGSGLCADPSVQHLHGQHGQAHDSTSTHTHPAWVASCFCCCCCCSCQLAQPGQGLSPRAEPRIQSQEPRAKSHPISKYGSPLTAEWAGRGEGLLPSSGKGSEPTFPHCPGMPHTHTYTSTCEQPALTVVLHACPALPWPIPANPGLFLQFSPTSWDTGIAYEIQDCPSQTRTHGHPILRTATRLLAPTPKVKWQLIYRIISLLSYNTSRLDNHLARKIR